MKLYKHIASVQAVSICLTLASFIGACQRSAQFSSGGNQRGKSSADLTNPDSGATPGSNGSEDLNPNITDTTVVIDNPTSATTGTDTNTSVNTDIGTDRNTSTNTSTTTSTATTTNTNTPTTDTSTTTTTTTNTNTNTNTTKDVTIEKDFATAMFERLTMTFMPTYGTVRQTFPMTVPLVAKATSKQQAIRTEKQSQFKQGFYGEKIAEDFSQNKLGVLDLLVILDNSTSMQDELNDISKRLEPLISSVSGSDWRIAFIKTDPREECIMSFVSRDDKDAAENFRKTIMSVKPDSDPRAQKEHGILQSVRGLADLEKCRVSRDSWVRPKSNVAVLIISDEDNCQGDAPGDTTCEVPASNNAEYLTDYMKNNMGRTLGVDAKVYSIVWDPARAICQGGYGKGHTYKKATDLSKGKMAHICDRNFESTLSMISKDLKITLKNQLTLKQVPNENTLKIYVNNTLWTTGYTVDQQILTFTTVPPVGATIHVEYETPSEPVRNAFVFDEATKVDANTLRVLVNGVAQPKEAYDFIAAQNTLEFKQAPAELATITVYFKDATQLLNSFVIDGKPASNLIRVYVDNVPATNFKYDVASKTITFAQAPQDGAVIKIEYAEKGSPTLTYTLSPMVTNFIDLKAYRVGRNTESLAITLDKNAVTIKPEDFVEGENLVVDYRDPNTAAQKFMLSDIPYNGQLDIKLSGTTLCVANDFTLDGMELKTDCVLAQNEQITVSFDRVKARYQEFELSGVMDPEKAVWMVFVDNQETKQYTRQGSKIKFPSPLPETSVVRLRAAEKVPVAP